MINDLVKWHRQMRKTSSRKDYFYWGSYRMEILFEECGGQLMAGITTRSWVSVPENARYEVQCGFQGWLKATGRSIRCSQYSFSVNRPPIYWLEIDQ